MAAPNVTPPQVSRVLSEAHTESSTQLGHPEVRIELDESRSDEIDEAWVPVTTPDGPGILTWENSD